MSILTKRLPPKKRRIKIKKIEGQQITLTRKIPKCSCGNEGKRFAMTYQQTYNDGSEEWFCQKCGSFFKLKKLEGL